MRDRILLSHLSSPLSPFFPLLFLPHPLPMRLGSLIHLKVYTDRARGLLGLHNDPKQKAQKQEQTHHQLQGYCRMKSATGATKCEDRQDRPWACSDSVGCRFPGFASAQESLVFCLGSLNHFLWEVPICSNPEQNLSYWSAAYCLPGDLKMLLFRTWIFTSVSVVSATPRHGTWKDLIESLSHPALTLSQFPPMFT